RLGWKTSRLGGQLRFKRPDGGAVAVELGSVSRPRSVAPQTLAALSVEAGAMRGEIERELGTGLAADETSTPDADVVVWRRTIGESPAIEHRVRLGANKAAKWLERTLHRSASDPAFIESVAFAEQIVEDGLTVGGAA